MSELRKHGSPHPAIVEAIEEELGAVNAWVKGNSWEMVFKCVMRLEGLVELLEVLDCGQVGGFGDNQPDDDDILVRAGWLIKKYTPIPIRMG